MCKSLLVSLSMLLIAQSATVCLSKTIKGSVTVSNSVKTKHTHNQLLANSTFKSGQKLFQQKNYAGAMNCFQELDRDGYCCDTIHYYIGQCYQSTNQTVAAQQHYDWVLEKSKDPTLRTYADYANRTIAYYNRHRSYIGQGNYFDRGSGAGNSTVSLGMPPRRIGFG